jgi:uncharacterized protein (DUF2062 family)
MTPASSPLDPAFDAPRAPFWRRRILHPLVALLTQGVTPDKLAATLAVGVACSLFPFLGTTSVLNLGVGLWLRMNQPLLQTLNQVLGPVQLAMILVHVRIGEVLWRASDAERFGVVEMVRAFSELPFSEFLQRFGRAGMHAFTGWVLTAPVLAATLYLLVRPVLRRLASRKAGAAGVSMD